MASISPYPAPLYWRPSPPAVVLCLDDHYYRLSEGVSIHTNTCTSMISTTSTTSRQTRNYNILSLHPSHIILRLDIGALLHQQLYCVSMTLYTGPVKGCPSILIHAHQWLVPRVPQVAQQDRREITIHCQSINLTLSCASILAPFSTSSCTVSRWPFSQAQRRGVYPS